MKENPDRKIKKGAKRLKTQDPTKLENIKKVQTPHASPVGPPQQNKNPASASKWPRKYSDQTPERPTTPHEN